MVALDGGSSMVCSRDHSEPRANGSVSETSGLTLIKIKSLLKVTCCFQFKEANQLVRPITNFSAGKFFFEHNKRPPTELLRRGLPFPIVSKHNAHCFFSIIRIRGQSGKTGNTSEKSKVVIFSRYKTPKIIMTFN